MRYAVGAASALLALIVGFSTARAATTLYVSPTGSDRNPGTLTEPLATPGAALAGAKAGDTVYLRRGRYTVRGSLTISTNRVTLAAYPGEHAAIVGPTNDPRLEQIITVFAGGVTIKDLELQGGYYYGIKLDNASGAQRGQRVVGCYIHHTGRDGIKTQDADGVLIAANEIGPTGLRDPSNAEGIDMIGSLPVTIDGALVRPTIRGNYIHDTATNGLYVKGGTVGAVVEKNLVRNTGGAGILLGSETDREFMRNGARYEASDSVARNNIIVNSAWAGLGTIAGDGVRFENNTIVNAARKAQGAFRAAPNQRGVSARAVVFKNNVVILDPASARPLVYLYKFTGTLVSNRNAWFGPNNATPFWVESASGLTHRTLSQWRQETGRDVDSISADPKLDATAMYRPRAGSPALDAGERIADVTDDYSGIPRPQGAAFAIGAHQTVAAPAR